MNASANEGALAGLRVLDLTRVLAGPVCAMMLGDMGADVIKIEPVGSGDDTRSWGPPFLNGESAYFLGANRNKRGITLNMAVEAGQEILAALIAQSDVLVENFKTGTLARWGFDAHWFESHAPRVIRCSITGYGTTGPKAAMPGYDFILQAESGLMSICGAPECSPAMRSSARSTHAIAPAAVSRSKFRSSIRGSSCLPMWPPTILLRGETRAASVTATRTSSRTRPIPQRMA
jgi:crotonobetainyl-CoA:carnitine CoA-transferase CaiB-like acyl-CoA transferase